jgi:hypothetical protein
MSVTVARAEPSIAGVGDYIELMKPRVMSLVVFTALVGLVVAPVPMHPVMAFTALLCIAVGAGAAGALNMWYDADIDARMARTAARPIPAGRLARGEALAFGLTLAGFSVVVLGLLVNVFAALLLAATIGFYVGIYTVWLKRWTPQNIVIGGAAGALPPVIGWASATGGVGIEPLVLFLIVFLWTPPHFWALSLYRAEDYGRRRTDASRRRWRRRNAPPNSPLHAGARAGRCCAVAARLCRRPIWKHRRAGGRRDGCARPPRSRRSARLCRQQTNVRLLDFVSVLVVRHAAGRSHGGRIVRAAVGPFPDRSMNWR